MKTARISFLVEVGEFAYPVDQALAREQDFSLRLQPLAGCQFIGEPKVELDEHLRCSMSRDTLNAAIKGMREYGGGFASRLADLLDVADSGNTEKLLDTFHDVIWNYVPMGEVAR
ncbi:hypothetical protein J7E62_24585 [Variovorax paradoxus]|nr:hypothetical protein [Variovorax paradoxus]